MMRYTEETFHGHKAECAMYESVDEYISWLRERQDLVKSRRDTYRDYNLRTNGDWHGRKFNNIEEYWAAAKAPWAEGLSLVDFMAERLEKDELPKPTSIKRKPRWDEYEGDDLDMPRVWGGEAAWRTTHKQRTVACQTITVIADISALGGVEPNEFLWRGVAAAALTRVLETAGFRVEFWSATQSRSVFTDGTWHCQGVCVKQAQDALDTVTLVNTVSAWWFRVAVFGARLSSPFRGDRVEEYFGKSVPLATHREFAEQLSPDPHKIIISDVWDFKEAVALVNREVAKVAQLETSV